VLEIQKPLISPAHCQRRALNESTSRAVLRKCLGSWKLYVRRFSIPVDPMNPFLKIEPPIGEGADLIERNSAGNWGAVGLALRSFEKL